MNVSGWDTSNATTMQQMFQRCDALTVLDISNFNTVNVTSMRSMFNTCGELTTVYVSETFTTNAVTDYNYMFKECSKIIGGNGTVFNSSYIDGTYARVDTAETPGYFTLKVNSK